MSMIYLLSETLPTTLEQIDWRTFWPMIKGALSAIAILIIGWMFAGWASRTVRKRLGDDKGIEVSATIRPLVVTILRYMILMITVYAAMKVAGIPPTGLLAVFGAAGLAIALAMQGTLSNIAAGIMLLFLKIFQVGDYILGPKVEGTVLEIGLFVTKIKNPSGVLVTIPNSQIWNSEVANFSAFGSRRIDVNIDVARTNDLEKALNILRATAAESELITEPESISAALIGYTQSAAKLQLRCWIAAKTFRADQSTLNVLFHEALKAGGITLPPLAFAEPV